MMMMALRYINQIKVINKRLSTPKNTIGVLTGGEVGAFKE